MEQDHLDEDAQNELEQEREKALKKEESARQLKAILFVFLPLLIAFLIFTYYFLRMVEANKIG